MNGQWIWLLGSLLALFIGIAIGFMIKQIQTKNDIESQKAKAGEITKEANEKAKDIELQARDSALEIRQKAEAEVARRRQELNREEDRLQKRRDELDDRTDRLEKREQALNKRQSAVDKRANEIDKIHEQEMLELQRVSQMSVEEARAQLLAEVEKDTRNDMARIIRHLKPARSA